MVCSPTPCLQPFVAGNSGCDEACQRAFYTYNQIFSKEDQQIFKQLGNTSSL
jgi:hypothetical protein